MQSTDNVCQTCAQPARTCVLRGYAGGEPQYERYCFDCVDRYDQAACPIAASRAKTRISVGSIMLTLGLLLGVFVLSSDFLGTRGGAGVGPIQGTGLVAGAVFIILGALLSIEPLLAGGALIFGICATADLFALGTVSLGIGWREQTGLLAAGLLVISGVYARRRARRPQLA